MAPFARPRAGDGAIMPETGPELEPVP
jgi:hypothetical protein